MNMYTQNYDRPPASQLSMASLILGVISILFLCCGTSFFFAAPGIVLALLSRGNREMDSMARAGQFQVRRRKKKCRSRERGWR